MRGDILVIVSSVSPSNCISICHSGWKNNQRWELPCFHLEITSLVCARIWQVEIALSMFSSFFPYILHTLFFICLLSVWELGYIFFCNLIICLTTCYLPVKDNNLSKHVDCFTFLFFFPLSICYISACSLFSDKFLTIWSFDYDASTYRLWFQETFSAWLFRIFFSCDVLNII